MIIQDSKNQQKFYLNLDRLDADLWDIVVQWVSSNKPPHEAKRQRRRHQQGDSVVDTDLMLEFQHARDAMEFKLRFSVL